MRAILIAHPAAPCEFIDSFAVWVERMSENSLSVRYVITGDMTRVALPAPAPPRRTDKLWEHTCFEVFARQGCRLSYCEFNFSPGGSWAAYRFNDYRTDMAELAIPSAPKISFLEEPNRFQLDAKLESALAGGADDALLLALAAIIEDRDGYKSYWALAHPTMKPDFHHADAFTLAVPREG